NLRAPLRRLRPRLSRLDGLPRRHGRRLRRLRRAEADRRDLRRQRAVRERSLPRPGRRGEVHRAVRIGRGVPRQPPLPRARGAPLLSAAARAGRRLRLPERRPLGPRGLLLPRARPRLGAETPPMSRARLRTFIRPHAGRLVYGTFLLLLTNLLDKSIPYMLKLAVDGFRDDALDDV